MIKKNSLMKTKIYKLKKANADLVNRLRPFPYFKDRCDRIDLKKIINIIE